MAAIKIESGKWAAMWFPKVASTAFSPDSLLMISNGFVRPATSVAGAEHSTVAGVYQGALITSADTTTALIRVMVPQGAAQVRATGISGTLEVASLGSQTDMYDAQIVNANYSTYGPLTCTKYISATEGLFVISKSVYSNVA